MKERDIKELRVISSPLMIEREVLIKPTKRFINLLVSALDEVESNAKSENESEEKSMLHNVTVKHEENKVLEKYWLMRTIKDGDMYGQPPTSKRVIAEKECTNEPTPNEIAQFLSDSKADFVSVVQNYRFENKLPFC